MKNKVSKTYYRISRTKSSAEYEHINIEIIESHWRHDQFGRSNTDFDLQWQTHKGAGDWYGGNIRIRTKSLSAIKRVSSFLKSICGESNGLGSPEEVIAALEAKKIKRGVYDGRVSEVVGIDDVAPFDHVRWGAINERGGWTLSIVAPRNNEEASRLLAKALSDYSLEAYEKWILAGKPIGIDDLSSAPTTFPIDLTPL
jgi:hypothetical protein